MVTILGKVILSSEIFYLPYLPLHLSFTQNRTCLLSGCSNNHLLKVKFTVVSPAIPLLLLFVLMSHFLTHIFLFQSLSHSKCPVFFSNLVEIWQDLGTLTVLKSFKQWFSNLVALLESLGKLLKKQYWCPDPKPRETLLICL